MCETFTVTGRPDRPAPERPAVKAGSTPLLYLASPYSHPDPAVAASRASAAARCAARLLEQGNLVFSPIAHSVSLLPHMDNPGGDWQTWARLDEAMLERCDGVVVVQLDGWRESKGVAEEISIAQQLGLPLIYVDADGRQATGGCDE